MGIFYHLPPSPSTPTAPGNPSVSRRVVLPSEAMRPTEEQMEEYHRWVREGGEMPRWLAEEHDGPDGPVAYGTIKITPQPQGHRIESAIPCPPPATPPAAEPAEPSSGPGRSTAEGAGSCCEWMRRMVAGGYLKPCDYGCQVAAALMRSGKPRGLVVLERFDYCPTCGTKL